MIPYYHTIPSMSRFQTHYDKIQISPPVYHFVLGSGYSTMLDDVKESNLCKNWEEKPGLSFKEASLPHTTVDSHPGVFRYFLHKPSGSSIVFQNGRLHSYEGHPAEVVAQPVVNSFLSGTKNFIVTNISGSLKTEHKIGTVVALTDHFNRMGQSPLIGSLLQDECAQHIQDRFPDMSAVYNAKAREQIMKELIERGLKVVQGIYVGVLGPEMETPAEIQWLNRSSQDLFDAIGMSTVLEVIALQQLGACISGFSLISNPAAGVDKNYKQPLSQDMLSNIQVYVRKMIEAFFIYSEKQFC